MAGRMQSAKLELKLKVLLKYIVVKTVAQHNSTLSSSHTTLDTGRQAECEDRVSSKMGAGIIIRGILGLSIKHNTVRKS